MINKLVFSIVLIALLTKVEAKMDRDGLWTGYDWYDEESTISVKNGIAKSNDFLISRKIVAARPLDGNDFNYMRRFNVWRVRRHVKK